MVIRRDTPIEPPSATAADALLSIIAILIGMIPALDRFFPYNAGSFSLAFVIGIAFGTLGYWVGTSASPLGLHRRWAAAFVTWAVVTVAATGPLTGIK